MSHYLNLSDEGKIKLAQESVRCHVPIAPVVAAWLRENNLYDMVTNPRGTHENGTTGPSGP